jgi:hypothetical protein
MTRSRAHAIALAQIAIALVVYPAWGLYKFWRDLFGGLHFEYQVFRQNWRG